MGPRTHGGLDSEALIDPVRLLNSINFLSDVARLAKGGLVSGSALLATLPAEPVSTVRSMGTKSPSSWANWVEATLHFETAGLWLALVAGSELLSMNTNGEGEGEGEASAWHSRGRSGVGIIGRDVK
ncbi:hypothetical protein K0M31_013696 [Melipona bicolor]|uniref:Uncharacterized protein n=1 Tax=Melipona bicolor TaxID=60889 RepID=A0AA40FHQ1_9HYME|nr:hypothetical protein K0M31_013696 [Melipona bicolor]